MWLCDAVEENEIKYILIITTNLFIYLKRFFITWHLK